MEQNILLATTVGSTVRAFLYPHIIFLQKKGYRVIVVSSFVKHHKIKTELEDMGCTVYDVEFSRNISDISRLIESKKQLEGIKNKEKIDVVYTHTPIASFLVRYVFRKEKSKVIYFAHGLHFFKGAPLKNWMFLYPAEKLALRWTDVVITINQEDYDLMSKKSKKTKVDMIPGVGLSDQFIKKMQVAQKNDKSTLIQMTQLNNVLEEEDFIILSVGELNDNKNQLAVVQSVKKIVDKGYNHVKYLIAGKGVNHQKIHNAIVDMGLENNVFLLGSRSDVASLLSLSDLFISMSKREGLPVSIIEAMASGKPVLVTDIRGHRDLISNDFMRLPLKEIEVYLHEKIKFLLENKEMRDVEARRNKQKSEKYHIENVLKNLGYIF